MFKKRNTSTPTFTPAQPSPSERVTSIIASGINLKGQISGSGGMRIEGAVDGDIAVRGMVVVAETGRVTCQQLRANLVIIAGSVKADITAEKVEIRSTGRVWGNVVTAAFATEEGAFLRGQIRMEEQVDIGVAPPAETPAETSSIPEEGITPSGEKRD